MSELIGIIDFQYPLLCRGDVLGRNYITNINGVNATVTFPSIITIPCATDYRFGENEPALKGPSYFHLTEMDRWGRILRYNTKKLDETSLMGVLVKQVMITVTTEHADYEEEVSKLSDGINKWRGQLHERTNLIGKSTIKSSNTIAFEQKGKGIGIELYDKEKRAYVPMEIVENFQVDLYSFEQYMLPEEVELILSEIDVNKRLKTEYQLLSKAICEKRSGRTRFAVMEATTAVELCVTQKIQERCKELGIDGIGLCEAFYRSLGNRFDLLKQLGIELATKDPGKEIVKPRNDLFHNRKLEPTIKECQEVISSVRAYLEKYIPDMYEDMQEL